MKKKTLSEISLIIASAGFLLTVMQALRLASDNTMLIRLIVLGQIATLLIVLLLLLTLNEILNNRE